MKYIRFAITIIAVAIVGGCLSESEQQDATGDAPTTPPTTNPPPAPNPPPASNQPPVAVISATPTSGAAALEVQVSGSQSSDDGAIVGYSWDFGDGTIIEGASTSHLYTQAGSYDVTLTVSDDEGESSSASTRISVFDANAEILYVNNSGSPACSDSTSYRENSPSMPWCTLLRAVRGNSDGNRNSSGVPAETARAFPCPWSLDPCPRSS